MIKYEEFVNGIKPRVLIIFGVAILLFCSALMYLIWRGNREVFAYEFNGVVEKITYDIKDDPTVIVNNQQFLLSQIFWNTNHEIEKGDSISKQAGSMKIILVKHTSHKTMLFYPSR